MDALLQDLAYSVRTLVRRPVFTVLALLTIALGIGANSAIFTVVHAVLLRPLPFPEPDRLVMVWEQDRTRGWERVPGSAEDYLTWKDDVAALDALGGVAGSSFTLTRDGEPERVSGARVTADFFDVFRVAPALGVPFGPEATVDGAHRRVVLSHDLWERRYGGDPEIVGRTVEVDGEGYEVAAVMPPGFRFPSTAEMWVPLVFSDAQLQDRNWHFLLMVGRLADGVALEGARDELGVVASRLAADFPDSNEGWGVTALPLHAEMTTAVRDMLWVLAGAVGFVLLIACANVANLLLVRASGRTREFALRASLGADRGRLVRQLLTESVVLAVAGGLLGLGLAALSLDLLLAMSPVVAPGGGAVTIDGTVLAATALGTLVSGLVFGAAPAWAALKSDLQGALKAGTGGLGRGGQRARSLLVVVEVGLAVVLVTGAGLMIQSVRGLLDVDVGVREPEQVLLTQFALPPAAYPDAEDQVLFYDQLLEGARSLPDVQAAALTTLAPPASGGQFHVRIEGLHDAWTMDLPVARNRSVGPGFFEAMGVPVLRGRAFTQEDRSGTPRVVVVDQAFVDEHFPDRDPLGEQIRTLTDEPLEIVGVVGNVANTGLGNDAQATTYLPYPQFVRGTAMTLAVRTAGDPRALAAPIREALWALDPNLPLVGVGTLADRLGDSVAQPRFNSTLLTVFAALALLLAAVGIYGVMAFAVSERTREMGLRMALGATGTSVRGLVLRRALVLSGGGVFLGVLAALGLGRVLAGSLYGIRPTDPVTLAAVSVLLIGVSLLASFLPAVRASRLDPQVALRQE